MVFPLLPYFKSNQFLLVLVLVYALVGVSLDDADRLGRAGQFGPFRAGGYRRLPDRPLGGTSPGGAWWNCWW